MKKLFYSLLAVSLIFTACKKEEGCKDLIATNYNPDAEVDDGSCSFGLVGGVWIGEWQTVDFHMVASMGGMTIFDTSGVITENNPDSLGTGKFWDNGDYKGWDSNNNLEDSGSWVQSGNIVTIEFLMIEGSAVDTTQVYELISISKTNEVHKMEWSEAFSENGVDYVVDYIGEQSSKRDENGFTPNNTSQRKGSSTLFNSNKLLNSINN